MKKTIWICGILGAILFIAAWVGCVVGYCNLRTALIVTVCSIVDITNALRMR